jgi:hypothetical protein
MRYYKIEFSNPLGGFPSNVPAVFESHANGIYNPGCLEIEFDIANVYANMSIPATHLRIHNVPVAFLKNARSYNGMNITLSGGFKPANPNYQSKMPLENPALSGVLGQGVVNTCFGNWLGTNLVLDFLIWPSPTLGSNDLVRSPNNGSGTVYQYNFEWTSGSLLNALTQMFSKLGFSMVPDLKIDTVFDKPPTNGFKASYTTFGEMAAAILSMSISVRDPSTYSNSANQGVYQEYRGVWIGFKGPNILVYDGTQKIGAVQLKDEEFIGQPTFVTADGIVQSVHPMRNDILLGYDIQYPQNIPTIIGPQYTPSGREYSLNASSSTLRVQQVRHVGKFRGTSATSWATYVNAGSAIRIPPVNPKAGEKITTGELIQYPF